MTDQQFFQYFRQSVSNERLDKYIQRGAQGGDKNLLTHYAWNIALSESFYPLLQCVEVALRNAVHNAASNAFGRHDWYDIAGLLNKGSLDNIDKARRDLAKARKPDTPPQIVATVNFGFWTGLFYGQYDQTIFPHIAKDSFPNLDKSLRVSKTISKPLNNIRKFRNRIMHHEPIWHFKDLDIKHDQMLDVIGWINPAMLEFVSAIDRFPAIYQRGMTSYQHELEKIFPRIVNPA